MTADDWEPPPDNHAAAVPLPVDRIAELALIGAIMLEAGAPLDTLGIDASDFFHADTRRTYQCMVDAWAKGLPADFVCVPPDDDDGTVRNVMHEALNVAPTAIFAPQYAERVRALSEKRRLLATFQRGAALSLNGASPDQIIEFAQTALEERRNAATFNPFDRWESQGITAAEAAQAELAERIYVIQDMIRVGSLTIFYGNPGDLKSALVMDAVLCIANGRPWLEALTVNGNTQRAFATRLTRALWLNYDQGHEDVLERLAAMARTYGGGENVTAISHSSPPAILETERQARRLGEWIRSQGYGLVVVDSLLDVRGKADLQEAAMGDVLRLWRIVAEESGAAIILIAHSTKATGDLYGSQFIKAKLDHAYHVVRTPGTDNVTIEAAKQRSYGETAKIGARWTYSHFAGTRTLQGARFWGDNSGAAIAGGGSVQDAVKAILMANPGRVFIVSAILDILNDGKPRSEQVDSAAVRVALNRLAGTQKGFRKLSADGQPNRYCFGDPLASEGGE